MKKAILVVVLFACLLIQLSHTASASLNHQWCWTEEEAWIQRVVVPWPRLNAAQELPSEYLVYDGRTWLEVMADNGNPPPHRCPRIAISAALNSAKMRGLGNNDSLLLRLEENALEALSTEPLANTGTACATVAMLRTVWPECLDVVDAKEALMARTFSNTARLLFHAVDAFGNDVERRGHLTLLFLLLIVAIGFGWALIAVLMRFGAPAVYRLLLHAHRRVRRCRANHRYISFKHADGRPWTDDSDDVSSSGVTVSAEELEGKLFHAAREVKKADSSSSSSLASPYESEQATTTRAQVMELRPAPLDSPRSREAVIGQWSAPPTVPSLSAYSQH